MTWPPPMPPTLRRMWTSPITNRSRDLPEHVRAEVRANIDAGRDDPRSKQLQVTAESIRDEFLLACITHGFDDDTIVMLAREHPATKECYWRDGEDDRERLEQNMPSVLARLRTATVQ